MVGYRYALPLHKAVTSGSSAAARRGFLLRIEDDTGLAGLGEVAPLEGLHAEHCQQVEEQLRLLCRRLQGVHVPLEVAFLAGSMSEWIAKRLGFDDKVRVQDCDLCMFK